MERTNAAGMPVRHGREPSLAGRHAECDGGGAIPGTRFAGREDFAGTLTGEYVDHGEPPWRWYLLADLTRKPPGYPAEAVWCESENLFLIDAEGRTLPDSLSGRQHGR
jgi:hypothetical protein